MHATILAILMPTAANPLADLVPATTGIFGSLTSGIANSLDQKLEDAINDAAKNVVSHLGLHQFYDFYVGSTCEGEFTPNAAAPNAKKNTTRCEATSKLGKISIPYLRS